MYVQNRHLGQSEELVTEGPHKRISVPLSSMVSKSSAENLAWFLFLDLGYFMCYFYIMSLFCKSFSNHWANRQFDSVTRNSAITQVQDPGGSGQPLRSLSPQPHQLPRLLSLHAFSAHTAGSSPSLPSAPPPRSWPWPSLPHTLGLPALLLEFCTFYFIIDAINKKLKSLFLSVCSLILWNLTKVKDSMTTKLSNSALVVIMINNTFLIPSLGWWLWHFLWGIGPKGIHSQSKVPGFFLF